MINSGNYWKILILLILILLESEKEAQTINKVEIKHLYDTFLVDIFIL
jgi:hypothetical protein